MNILDNARYYLSRPAERMDSPELALSAMYRMLKKSGAHRVSDESAAELRSVVEAIASEIAIMAVKASEHANRRTVRADDVKFAYRTLMPDLSPAARAAGSGA